MGLYDIKVKDLRGADLDFSDYQGKVLLIVNTASRCGFTPQYQDLEQLYQEYQSKGLEIIGFPCNQFGQQEKGSDSEILEFCQLNYGVHFTMGEKLEVNGKNESPLYTFLKSSQKNKFGKAIKWNFTKFLINREGMVVERFSPQTNPQKLRSNIEALL